jgi:hypothetical protein
MSNLADKTDVITIRAAARAIHELDKVCFSACMTREDDEAWTQARNLLHGIIGTAGYEMQDNYRVKRVNSGYPEYRRAKK